MYENVNFTCTGIICFRSLVTLGRTGVGGGGEGEGDILYNSAV